MPDFTDFSSISSNKPTLLFEAPLARFSGNYSKKRCSWNGNSMVEPKQWTKESTRKERKERDSISSRHVLTKPEKTNGPSYTAARQNRL
jgi:hypothetical protein